MLSKEEHNLEEMKASVKEGCLIAEGKPNREYLSKGATGIGARLLYQLAKIY